MRTKALLAQCLPGFISQDRGCHMSVISDRDVHLPSPAVEIVPSKAAHPYKYAGETIDLQGINLFKDGWLLITHSIFEFGELYLVSEEVADIAGSHLEPRFLALKGRVSVADIIGFTGSEAISSKSDGHLKSWDSSIDLVNVLKHEIRDGQLSLRGKRVLELGCSHGLPGIFACLKGASTVHFQDLSAETIRCTTIPNVLANLEQARDRQSRQPESPLTPSRQILAPVVHFYAGEWEELPTVLSVVRNDISEVPTGMSLSLSEEDFMDGCSSQEGSILAQESSLRRSRKLSGSRAWERANDADNGEGGYDVILMTELPYSVPSLKKLHGLIKKCLRPPYGVIYLAAKRNYVSFNSAARHLRSVVDEEGVFGAHLVKELTDREIWKFFFK